MAWTERARVGRFVTLRVAESLSMAMVQVGPCMDGICVADGIYAIYGSEEDGEDVFCGARVPVSHVFDFAGDPSLF